jgi:hypothetical protein
MDLWLEESVLKRKNSTEIITAAKKSIKKSRNSEYRWAYTAFGKDGVGRAPP